MHRPHLAILGILATATLCWAAEPPVPTENQDTEHLNTPGDSEPNVVASTSVVTPATAFPEKLPYDQSRDELAETIALWTKGDADAACDAALQAYEDLLTIHRSRKKRPKLRDERRQAATIYVQACILTIHSYMTRAGNTPAVLEEGRERLQDLHDVARDYENLNQMVQQAIAEVPAPKP